MVGAGFEKAPGAFDMAEVTADLGWIGAFSMLQPIAPLVIIRPWENELAAVDGGDPLKFDAEIGKLAFD